MADVTEVIHKITYEVNSAELTIAGQLIQQQVQELYGLNKSINDLQRQLSKLNDNNVQELERLSKSIDGLVGKMEKSAARTKGALEQMARGALKGLGGKDGLEGVLERFVKPLMNDLPNAAKTSEVSIGAMMGKLLTVGNVATLAIGVLSSLATAFLDTSTKAEVLTDEMKAADEILSDFASNASQEIGKFNTLINIIQSANTTYAQKKAAMDELRNAFPEYLGTLKDEEFFTEKAVKAYDRLIESIYKKARAQAYQAKYNEAVAKQIELEEKINFQKSKIKPRAGKSPVKIGNEEVMMETFYMDPNEDAAYREIEKLEKERDLIYGKLRNYAQAITANYVPETRSGSDSTSPAKRVVSSPRSISKENIEPLSLYNTTPESFTPKPVDTSNAEDEYNKIKQREEDAINRRKQNTLDAIFDYQTLAQSVADAYNTIVQVQINALDKEIAIREKRVEAAQKLAERGNVEALRMEEERLRQAQNMREQFARRQQIVNSAITVSNAIAAVARAALEGGGFGSAATIAALIAALAAGYAAVSSMSNDNAFADGVVDYKGKGGPRDDANWVRISSGESVITADGTKANRHILEAINSGAHFKLMNPALPYTMPMFRSPDGSGVYASAQDLGALESKLDNVVNAIEDNRLRQNIYFNEHGVGIMTEKAMRRDRRRWL